MAVRPVWLVARGAAQAISGMIQRRDCQRLWIILRHAMKKIGLSKFKANCASIVERVAKTGEPVTITQKGVPVARLVAPHAHTADHAKLDPIAATLDLDEDVIDADELIEAEQVAGQWDALNSAIDAGSWCYVGHQDPAKRRAATRTTTPTRAARKRQPV